MRISFEGLSTASTSTQLPEGPYAFGIDSFDADYESQEKGSKGLEVKCHVIDGVEFEDGSSTTGLQRTIRFWYPHAGQKDKGKFCKGRLNEFLTACGIDTCDDDFDPEDLANAQFKARCHIKKDKETGREGEEFDKFGPY